MGFGVVRTVITNAHLFEEEKVKSGQDNVPSWVLTLGFVVRSLTSTAQGHVLADLLRLHEQTGAQECLHLLTSSAGDAAFHQYDREPPLPHRSGPGTNGHKVGTEGGVRHPSGRAVGDHQSEVYVLS